MYIESKFSEFLATPQHLNTSTPGPEGPGGTPDTGHNTGEYWILDTGYWILDTGYWILDTGYLDTGYWTLDMDTGYWTLPDTALDYLDTGGWGQGARLEAGCGWVGSMLLVVVYIVVDTLLYLHL